MEIGFTKEGWFVLRMDPLAGIKDEASKARIRAKLAPEIKKFFADKDTVRYPKCTVIFRHVYTAECPEYRLRDYDNVEAKLVLDIVAMYVMVDDNPLRCNVYHCSVPGSHPFTEVYVIPQTNLVKWLEKLPHSHVENVDLTDQVPEAWRVTM